MITRIRNLIKLYISIARNPNNKMYKLVFKLINTINKDTKNAETIADAIIMIKLLVRSFSASFSTALFLDTPKTDVIVA